MLTTAPGAGAASSSARAARIIWNGPTTLTRVDAQEVFVADRVHVGVAGERGRAGVVEQRVDAAERLGRLAAMARQSASWPTSPCTSMASAPAPAHAVAVSSASLALEA